MGGDAVSDLADAAGKVAALLGRGGRETGPRPPLLNAREQDTIGSFWSVVHSFPLETRAGWTPAPSASPFELNVWMLNLAGRRWPEPDPRVKRLLRPGDYHEEVARMLAEAQQMGGTAVDHYRWAPGPVEQRLYQVWIPPSYTLEEPPEFLTYGPRCTFTTYEPGRHDLAFTVEECDQIIAGLGRAEQAQDDPEGPLHRETTGVPWLWDRLGSVMVTANSAWWHGTMRLPGFWHVNEYRPGQRFSLHRDSAPFAADWTLAVVVLLTDPDEAEGGEFRVLERGEMRKVPLQKGTVLVLDVHTPHEVTPLISGRRITLAGFMTSHLSEHRPGLSDGPPDAAVMRRPGSGLPTSPIALRSRSKR